MSDITKIELGSYPVYERSENPMMTKLFGVPVYIMVLIGAVIWLIKER
jgi:hypothetical protein